MRLKIKSMLWSALAIATLLLAACTPAADTSLMPPEMMTQVPGDSFEGTPSGNIPMTGAEIDETFINMMVPHHQGAIEMAKIAQERSERPEITEMANAIISSQEAEISRMKDWKQQWYGSSDTPPMNAMPAMEQMDGMGEAAQSMDMQAEVDALRNAPEPFDLAFIDAMIPHHQSAIDAAQMVLTSATRPELRELAQQVIEAQQKEIDQMNNWRQTWFPEAPAAPND